MAAGSPWAHVTDVEVCGEAYNIKRATDLHRLGIWMKSFDILSHRMQWVLGSGATQCPVSSGESIQAGTDWFAWPKSKRTPLGHYVSISLTSPGYTSDCPETQWWSWSGRRSSRIPSIISLGACPDIVRHTCKLVWVPFLVAAMKFQQNGLDFQGVFIDPFVGQKLSFQKNNVASFHSETLPSPYQYRYPALFSSFFVPLIFPPVYFTNIRCVWMPQIMYSKYTIMWKESEI